MSSPWIAEQAVTADLAQELIESQFSQLAPAHLQVLGVGWDNSAFLLDGEFVFRFPRRQIAVDLLLSETSVLPVIAPRLPVNVPVPIFVGQSEPRFPWPFAGYRMLPGQTACAAALTDDDRMKLAQPLARFLAALHAIPTDEALACGARPDSLGRLDVQRRIPVIEQRLYEIVRLGLLVDSSPWNQILEDAAEVEGTDRTAWPGAKHSLVHGDLYARHLLVGEGRELCGVIDWGDIHVGDPAIDLALVCGFLPPAARDTFCAVYGPIDAATWRLARFKALLTAVMLVVYGHDVKDFDLRREGLTTLEYLRQ